MKFQIKVLSTLFEIECKFNGVQYIFTHAGAVIGFATLQEVAITTHRRMNKKPQRFVRCGFRNRIKLLQAHAQSLCVAYAIAGWTL